MRAKRIIPTPFVYNMDDELYKNKYANSIELKYAIENGIIDMSYIQDQILMKKREEYLKRHNRKIWQGTNGKWYTYLSDENGKNVLKKRSTKSDIDELVINYYKAIDEAPTFESVFYQWINSKIKYNEISKTTYDRYETDLFRFFPTMRKRKIKSITEDELEDYIKTTIAEKQLTAKAYAGMRTIIIGTFKYAYRKNYSTINIGMFYQGIEISRRSFKRQVKDKEHQVFTECEMKLMANYIRSKPTIRNLAILLCMQTGMRVGELSAIKQSDIYISERYIHVHFTEVKYKNDEGHTVIEVREYPKSEAGDRYLLISESAVKTIKEILKLNPFSEFLISENGKRVTTNGLNHKIRRICDAVNIDYRSIHKIRKTYGTILIDANVDDAFIKDQMGHADIKTTRQFYYYSNKDKKDRLSQLNNAMYY